MKADRRVTVNGDEFEDWQRLEVAAAGPNVSVTFTPIDPAAAIVPGDEIKVELGRVVEDGDTQWNTKADGLVAERSATVSWEGDSLTFVVDASSGRLKRSEKDPIAYTGEKLRKILRDVYVTRLRFSDLITNMVDYVVPSFEITPRESLHAAVAGLISGFSPYSYRDPLTDAWVTLDTKRPIPEDFPAVDLELGETLRWALTVPPPTFINVVEIQYLGSAENALSHFVERWRKIEDDKAPAGYLKSVTEVKERIWYDDPKHPDVPTRDPIPIVVRKTDYGADAREIVKTEVTTTYKAGTNDRLPESTVTKKWVRVTLPGGGDKLLLVREEKKVKRFELDAPKKTYRLVAEYGQIEGEVIQPDNLPLDEGSRAKLVGSDARQSSEWLAIEHSHTAVHRVGAEIQKVTTRWDDLNGGVQTQFEDTFAGDDETDITPPTLTYILEDAASIGDPKIGRRPMVTFDGTPYGLDLSIEIVKNSIFGGYAQVQPTAEVELLLPDPSRFGGQIVRALDRAGQASLWLVTEVRDVDQPDTNETTTTLSLLKLRTVAPV